MGRYDVVRMFADGVERKRTLFELAREIENDDPMMPVEIISEKKGLVWCGRAKNITGDLVDSFLKKCVQNICVDEYGVTLVMR